jgi:hypothetical protein
MYSGIRLKMISGGWCDSIVDLIQSIYHIEININDEDEHKIRHCLDRLKNVANQHANFREFLSLNYDVTNQPVTFREFFY